MTIAVPYDWLRHVPHSFVEKEDLPLFGYPPLFPWDQLGAIFAKIFQLESAQFTASAWEYRNGNALLSEMGRYPQPLFIDLAPLEGTLCFVMAKEDLERLMKLL